MRSFILSVAVFSLLAIPAKAQETKQPVKIESKMDSKLKEILETVVSAVVGRVPGVIHNPKSFVIADTSSVETGSIDGLLSIQVGNIPAEGEKAVPMFGTQAQVAVRFFDTANSENAVLNITTTGQVSSTDFILFVELLNSSVCIPVSAEECKVQPVVDAQDAAQSVQKRGELAIGRLKANLLAYIDAKVATAQPQEETQSFGGIFGGDEVPAVDPEKMQKMRTALENGLMIVSDGAKTVVSIKMDVVQALGSDLTEMNPAFGAIQKFSVVQMEVTETAASYQLLIESEFPKRLITNYDAYIKEEQARDQLVSLHELIMKITWWASGRCTKEKYQELCLNKILNTCAASVSSVGRCVTEAEVVQKGRDVKNGIGNFLNTITGN